MILENVNSPEDVKALSPEQLRVLSAEIREFLIKVTSERGGHLASNLGVVELTLALHRVFDCPHDRIIFDVSHQSYVHKIITGRKDGIAAALRTYGGISGFQKRSESDCDAFGSGHASTSVSAAVGFAAADKLSGSDSCTVAVIGDGALTGGMAYEALNNCAKYDNLIIVLNDNGMSISRNVGGNSRHLARIRTSKRYFRFKSFTEKLFGAVPGIGKYLVKGARRLKNCVKRVFVRENFFEQLGLHYFGPIDGKDIAKIEDVLREAKNDGVCSVVHICTRKGEGYPPAEREPDLYHGVSGFDIETGNIINGARSCSDVFGEELCRLAELDDRICAVTAAMKDGTGLVGFASRFPERFFDVGIAEEHAMTFSAGLAAGGKKPVLALYSTFAQRAYDQLIHDVALQSLPVVLAIDRAGIVGADGPTHHGMFDVSFMNAVPGLTVFSPYTESELRVCLKAALDMNAPCAVRYPRGAVPEGKSVSNGDYAVTDYGSGEFPNAAVVTYGSETSECEKACVTARANGMNIRLIRLIKIKPLPDISGLIRSAPLVVVAEEGMKSGGIGEEIAALCAADRTRRRVEILAADGFLPQGTIAELRAAAGIDADSILRKICG